MTQEKFVLDELKNNGEISRNLCLRKVSKNNKRKPLSDETKLKIGLANSKPKIGKVCLFCKKIFMVQPYREKTSKYCSYRCRGNYMKGKKPWNKGLVGVCKPNSGSFKKGMVLTPEQKKKQSIGIKKAMTGKKLSKQHRINIGKSKSLEKSPHWRGGKSFEKYTIEWTNKYKEKIREREYRECLLCGIKESELVGRFKRLDVHHVDYNKKNCSPINLVVLCHSCHVKTNFNRDYWERSFKLELNIIYGQSTKKSFSSIKVRELCK